MKVYLETVSKNWQRSIHTKKGEIQKVIKNNKIGNCE